MFHVKRSPRLPRSSALHLRVPRGTSVGMSRPNSTTDQYWIEQVRVDCHLSRKCFDATTVPSGFSLSRPFTLHAHGERCAQCWVHKSEFFDGAGCQPHLMPFHVKLEDGHFPISTLKDSSQVARTMLRLEYHAGEYIVFQTGLVSRGTTIARFTACVPMHIYPNL